MLHRCCVNPDPNPNPNPNPNPEALIAECSIDVVLRYEGMKKALEEMVNDFGEDFANAGVRSDLRWLDSRIAVLKGSDNPNPNPKLNPNPNPYPYPYSNPNPTPNPTPKPNPNPKSYRRSQRFKRPYGA